MDGRNPGSIGWIIYLVAVVKVAGRNLNCSRCYQAVAVIIGGFILGGVLGKYSCSDKSHVNRKL